MILFEKKYQTFDTVFHHQMKHLEVRQKYSAARRIFNSLFGVSSGDETLHLMFDILLLNLKNASVVFYLLTSLFFSFLILNEFKNTANLKQPSGHCYYRDRSRNGSWV